MRTRPPTRPRTLSTARAASLRRASRASGCAAPSSSSTPTTTWRSSSLRSSSPGGDGLDQRVQALLGLARVQRGERRRELGVVGQPERAARPSAANEPGTLASSSSAPSRSPAAASKRASGMAASARPGSSSSARRRFGLAARGDQRVGLGRDDAVEEALDLGRRQRADELVDDLAVLERLHGRDRLDPERLREPRVGVGVDLDELDLAVALLDGLLDHGPERAARTAPFGPEVDDHGLLEGALDDVALEGLFSGVDGHTARIEAMDFRIDADGVMLSGARRGGGAGRAAARPDRDAALRGDGLARARALRPPRDRLRRARPRASPTAPASDYGYERLADDLLAVLDDRGIDARRAGRRLDGRAHAHRSRSTHPERVAGARDHDPRLRPRGHDPGLERWDRLAKGLREGGVEGFVEAYGTPKVPEKWLETIDRVLHQRLSAHDHPEALADALQAVPRSRPFEDWGDLRRSTRRRWSSPAATRSTPSTRTPPASATPRRSRARGWSPRSRAPRRWRGRARRCRR